MKRGDIFLFNRTNSPELVGKTAVWDRDEPTPTPGICSECDSGKKVVLPDYVSAFRNSAYGKKMLYRQGEALEQYVELQSAGEFCRMELPVPEIAIQRRFAKTVSKLRNLKKSVWPDRRRPPTYSALSCNWHSEASLPLQEICKTDVRVIAHDRRSAVDALFDARQFLRLLNPQPSLDVWQFLDSPPKGTLLWKAPTPLEYGSLWMALPSTFSDKDEGTFPALNASDESFCEEAARHRGLSPEEAA